MFPRWLPSLAETCSRNRMIVLRRTLGAVVGLNCRIISNVCNYVWQNIPVLTVLTVKWAVKNAAKSHKNAEHNVQNYETFLPYCWHNQEHEGIILRKLYKRVHCIKWRWHTAVQNTKVWIRANCNGFMRFKVLTMEQLKTQSSGMWCCLIERVITDILKECCNFRFKTLRNTCPVTRCHDPEDTHST